MACAQDQQQLTVLYKYFLEHRKEQNEESVLSKHLLPSSIMHPLIKCNYFSTIFFYNLEMTSVLSSQYGVIDINQNKANIDCWCYHMFSQFFRYRRIQLWRESTIVDALTLFKGSWMSCDWRIQMSDLEIIHYMLPMTTLWKVHVIMSFLRNNHADFFLIYLHEMKNVFSLPTLSLQSVRIRLCHLKLIQNIYSIISEKHVIGEPVGF